jgi:hydroxyethylthiazole kinase
MRNSHLIHCLIIYSQGREKMDFIKDLETIRARKPLIHHITNWVTIYDCASVTRAVGALPIMSHAPEVVAEMTTLANALVLNIGTLTSDMIDSMKIAGKTATELKRPVVLDAVGAGATKLRTQKTKELMSELSIPIIKGNAGEIATISGITAEVKGVESISVAGDIVKIAQDCAQNKKAVVVVTGPVDIVTDGQRTFLIRNGHELMGKVVGTGCMLASVIGAFSAVNTDMTLAAARAVVFYDIAGELAAEVSQGPGTFRERFMDQIYQMHDSSYIERQKVTAL